MNHKQRVSEPCSDKQINMDDAKVRLASALAFAQWFDSGCGVEYLQTEAPKQRLEGWVASRLYPKYAVVAPNLNGIPWVLLLMLACVLWVFSFPVQEQRAREQLDPEQLDPEQLDPEQPPNKKSRFLAQQKPRQKGLPQESNS